MVWPLEAMPRWLALIAQFLPQTYAIKAMRTLIGRGRAFEDTNVTFGFISSAVWLVVFNALAMIAFSINTR